MKKLKVIGVPWHVPHQHELIKLSFIKKYDLIENPYRHWGLSARPWPGKAQMVSHFKRNYYDLAILHVDQQCIYDPEKGDRISKGKLYAEIKATIGKDCPIVTINHMTPFHDKYDSAYVVDYMKKMTAGTHMVVNSYTARQQWGWGTVITHGMSPEDWWDLPKEPRAVTVLSPAGMEKAYRRIFLTTVIRYLKEDGVPFSWILADRKFKGFDEYREFLGRSLVYFNPTWQSPRPRARTEAMLSGCCVVTTGYQDADTFIKHGENGFLTSEFPIIDPRVMDNPRATADLIKRLVFDEPELAAKVGQEGKETALKLFTHKQFEGQWKQFLKGVRVL